MGRLEQFKINLKGLKEATTTFSFTLDNDYFDAIEATEVKGGALSAKLSVNKVASIFELDFQIVGDAIVTCDLCLDDMSIPVDTRQKVVVRMGPENAEDGDTIIVAEDEGVIDVSWLIYEFIALSLPTRHVHADGQCNPDMLMRLQKMTVHDETDEDAEETTDPRWNKLKELKSTIKE